jgi:hypothetical protein
MRKALVRLSTYNFHSRRLHFQNHQNTPRSSTPLTLPNISLHSANYFIQTSHAPSKMAVLSTLRFQETVSAHQHSQMTQHFFEDQISYRPEHVMGPPCALEQTLPVDLHTFGAGLHRKSTEYDGYNQFREGHGHQQTPTDGPETFVWLCSNCGDGPYGAWQPCCQNCGHNKCGSCTVEQTK